MAKEAVTQLGLMKGEYVGNPEELSGMVRECVVVIESAYAKSARNLNNSIVVDAWLSVCKMGDLALNPEFTASYFDGDEGGEEMDEKECLFVRKCKNIDDNLLPKYLRTVREFVADTFNLVAGIGLLTDQYAYEIEMREVYWSYLINPDIKKFSGMCIPEKDNPVQHEIFRFDTFVSGDYVPAETINTSTGIIGFQRRNTFRSE